MVIANEASRGEQLPVQRAFSARSRSRSDDAVFIAGHAHVLCLERVVKCQSTETQIRHRVEAESELSRGWLSTNSLF